MFDEKLIFMNKKVKRKRESTQNKHFEKLTRNYSFSKKFFFVFFQKKNAQRKGWSLSSKPIIPGALYSSKNWPCSQIEIVGNSRQNLLAQFGYYKADLFFINKYTAKYQFMKEASCPYCSETMNSKEHFLSCPKSSLVKKEGKHAIHFADNLTICFKCSSSMQTIEYINHNRNCGRKMRYLSEGNSERLELGSIAGSKILTPKKNVLPDVGKHNFSVKDVQIHDRIDLDKSLHTLCENYLISFLKPHLLHWVQKNSNISSIVLFKVFQKYTHRVVDSLQLALPNVELSTVYQISKKVDWKKVILRIEDIYNKDLITSRIENLPQTQKNLVMKSLNKIYLQYEGIFEPFKVHKQISIPKNPRDKKPLLPKEFIEVLSLLFSTQKIGFIFIALELLIIYQSGQRFPSSYEVIEQSIIRLLKIRKKNPKQNGFTIISTKTKTKETVIFDQQLLKMLELFEWTKFSQQKRFYQRLSHYFPFSCYSLRRGFICFMYVSASNDSSAAIKLLTNHKSQKNVNFYIRSLIKSVHLSAKTHLRIPNSKILTIKKDQLFRRLPQFNIFTDKIQLSEDWFNQSYHKLKQIVDLTDCDCLDVKQIFIQPPQATTNMYDKNDEDNQESSESQKEITIQQEVIINDRIYKMKNKKFDLLSQYQQAKNGNCCICSQQIEQAYCCLNCGDIYHIGCIPYLFCSCHLNNLNYKGIDLGSTQLKSQIKLKMPVKYFGEQFENLNQIKFLIFMRGLNFTNVGVPSINCTQQLDISTLRQLTIASIDLPEFQRYQRYEYFPPIQLTIFGDNSLSGTGFGLTATQDIPSKIFIGEYAGDIILNSELKFTKRKDMTMELQALRQSSKSLSIGPVMFGGYIMLLNESQKGNCAAVKANINGKYKILIYTTKKIRKGTQLLYNYSRLQKSQIIDQDQDQFLEFNQIQNTNNAQCLAVGIKNFQNNCYVNSSLQILWKYKNFFKLPSQNLNNLLQQIDIFFQMSSGTYNPESLVYQICRLNPTFMKNIQSDAHECLDFILDQFERNDIDIQFMKVGKIITRKCNVCLRDEKENLRYQMIFLSKVHNPFEQLEGQKKQVFQLHKCYSCHSVGTTVTTEHFNQVNQIIVFVINRFEDYPSKKKDMTKVWIPSSLRIANINFKRALVVLHKGNTRQNGHYTTIDLLKNIEINDDKINNRYTFSGKDVVIVVFQREK